MKLEHQYTNRGKNLRRTMSRKIPTTIKDPELVAQRRREIIDVATHMFLERGFHKTSIRDIARACPFNLASLYMYVTSKEDILFLVAQQLIDEKARAMAAVEMLEDNPAESFRTALRSYCRIVHQYRPHIRLLYRELDVLSPQRREIVMASLSTVTDVFEQIVRKGIEKGVFAEVEPKLVALNALFLCHLWSMHARALRSITNDINEFFEMQSRIVLQGLLTREPVAVKRAAVVARRSS
jgi:TetR/AcrR family transcriptional regulator, cholesterol catabolism regulator